MEKNQEFTVSIEDMSEDGAGIGKLDGYIWFIKDAVIGDVVRARAMKMKKNYAIQSQKAYILLDMKWIHVMTGMKHLIISWQKTMI